MKAACQISSKLVPQFSVLVGLYSRLDALVLFACWLENSGSLDFMTFDQWWRRWGKHW